MQIAGSPGADMDLDLHRELMPLLERDFEFQKKHGDWLQGGRCPSCGKKELYTNKEHPWVLKCGRLSKCGLEIHIKEQYPELFDNWGERFPSTPKDPNAAADAYLRVNRGFDLDRVRGTYTQETFYDNKLKIGSATVRFALPMGGYWERLIDRPGRFEKKAHFNFGCKYHGTLWSPPMTMPDDEIWIVEGIFDSIALMHHGIWAGSAMNCYNYPHLFLTALAEQCVQNQRKRPKLVWALDNDRAGQENIKKWVDRSRAEGWESSAAVIRQFGRIKRDWNDMHLSNRLAAADIHDCRYRGALLTARSAADKAGIMFQEKTWEQFFFDFDNRLYWFEIDFAKLAAAKNEIAEKAQNTGKSAAEIHDMAMEASRSIREIANCRPTALYYQSNLLTDESWYYVKIDFPHDGPAVKNTFTGSQLSSATEFKKRLLAIAPGALYTGSAVHLDLWLKKQMFGIRTVSTIDFIGYAKEHGAWIFERFAVKDGRLYELNDEDFFDIGKLSIKSLQRSVGLEINSDETEYTEEWVGHLWTAYKAKGFVALAFWLGSLFAEQIRKEQKSYPFLEISGEPGSGKTTLIEFIWKLFGRNDYEGWDPARASAAGRARSFAQVSNLPSVLIESDRESAESDKVKQKAFEWDELKTAYNGRSLRTTGVKNSGNETYEPPFRGSIVIAQNAQVSASSAIMERICYMNIDKSEHTQAGKAAGDELSRMPVEALSGFMLKACKAEAMVMETLRTRFPVHEAALAARPDVKNQRLCKNHAQLMAMADALAKLVPMTEDQHQYVLDQIACMTVERQETIASDHPMVQEFWDLFDYLDGGGDYPQLNHSRDYDTTIAFNFNELVKLAFEKRQQLADIASLKKVLKTSRSRKFIAIKNVNSGLVARANAMRPPDAQKSVSVKCWVFQRPAGGRQSAE